MTDRSGKFSFQIGVDMEAVQPLLDRVLDAHARFKSVPMLPDISTKLEHEVLVSSVFGTNTIEGGTLTEEETAAILEHGGDVTEQKDKRVVNLKKVYKFIEDVAGEFRKNVSDDVVAALLLEEYMLTDLHEMLTDGLHHPLNTPGQYRDNEKGQLTRVGDHEHGGVYVAPKCRKDIEMLIKAFLTWVNDEEICGINPLVRASLVHYYFERVHPFWDGNGRVGRALEALVLKCSGLKYAPFALSKFYLEHIDEYFTTFNTARVAAEKKQSYPNTEFVRFFLEGMLDAFNRLHDRVNYLIGILLFETQVHELFHRKVINHRQHAIIFALLEKRAEYDLKKLQGEPWFQNLYKDRTRRTEARDLRKMAEVKLIEITPDRKVKLVLPSG